MAGGTSKWLSGETEEVELNEQQSAALELIKSVKTTPRGPAFPAQNQAPHCYQRYNEWVLCLKNTNDDQESCKNMRQLALSICPYIWYEKWDEEREAGTFPGLK